MSMVLCKYCERMVDTDDHPDGYDVIDKATGRQAHEDGNYICWSCAETEGVEP